MIGNSRIYWFTGFMVLMSIVFVIPNLSNNLSEYTKYVETFQSAKIEIEKRQKGFTTQSIYTLAITMQDGKKWVFDRQYEEYWQELGSKNNVGKRYTIYTKGWTDSNPAQVEIEGKIIYNLKTLNTSKYVILLLTSIGVIVSLIDYRKYLRKKHEVN